MLERIWKKIIRRRPYTLWDIPAFFLWMASLIYRMLFALHKATLGSPVRVSVPVMSIGNITVGGSGKTPLVSFIASDLLAEDIRVGIVSSGYGRTGTGAFIEPGYKVQALNVADTSDEVMLLAHAVPEAVFSVHPNKTEAARALADSGLVDVIVVDDGFQHFALERDIDIVAYDAGFKRRVLKPFPYGMLREPRSALKRADVIVITRAKFAMDLNAIKRDLQKINKNAEIYSAAFEANNLIGSDRCHSIKYIADKSVLLFAGVGNFRSLERQVSTISADLDLALEFSDHQVYDEEVLKRIERLADKHEPDMILTTFKDWVKIAPRDFGREFFYLDLQVDLDPGEEKLVAYLKDKLGLEGRTD